MAGLSRKNVRPLLRSINGKRHATDDDHKGPTGKRRADGETLPGKQKDDIDINADPMSSDDELRAPPPRSAKPSKPSMPAARSMDTELKRPQRKPAKKGTSIRAPTKGIYKNSQELKATDRQVDDKENSLTSSQASASSGPIQWSMEHVSQKNNKNVKGYGSKTRNIHTAAPRTFGKGPSKAVARTYTSARQPKGKQPDPGSDSDSSVSMLDDDELEKLAEGMSEPELSEDPELRRVGSKAKPTKAQGKHTGAAPYDDDKLSEVLDSISEQPMSEKSKKAAKTAKLLKQLNSWKENNDPPSSQPDSSAAQEYLDEVSNYIERLPEVEEEGSRCTLCSQRVEQTDYWDFWKGKDKTVKNKSAFCHLHKKISAQKAYSQAGYPGIDWTALPKRIRKNKATLTQILHNERPSRHRDRYEPLALTGKAAAVPSKRTDLSQAQQEQLESYALDERAAYPGYYGPHGRRLITENIMDLLKSEIKQCKDDVVQASGIAAFVQAVMVPEAAVLLIMEDCGVDREEAERVREDTYEMGLLVHEEIEDEVVRRPEDESDEENEYQIV